MTMDAYSRYYLNSCQDLFNNISTTSWDKAANAKIKPLSFLVKRGSFPITEFYLEMDGRTYIITFYIIEGPCVDEGIEGNRIVNINYHYHEKGGKESNEIIWTPTNGNSVEVDFEERTFLEMFPQFIEDFIDSRRRMNDPEYRNRLRAIRLQKREEPEEEGIDDFLMS